MGVKDRIKDRPASGNKAVDHDFFIQWHLTEKCNLDCIHCYQEGTCGNELTFSEVRDVIEEVAETIKIWTSTYDINYITSYSITGGEPFLRRDLFDIIEEINRKNIYVYILSNGTLIDRNIADRLSCLGIKGVQVSVEGPEDIHDKIRGKGSYARAMLGVERLLDAQIEVTLNSTLSKLNADFIGDLISLASNAGVQRLGFSRLVPSGSGKELINEMIDANRIREIYESLYSIRVRGLDIVTGDPVASCGDVKINSSSGCTMSGGCAAGLSGLTIRPDGTINPCRRLNISLGNIREDSLRDVWAVSEVLNMLRDKEKYQGKCGTCERWAHCRGCRAIAYAYSRAYGGGDFLSEDPQCFIVE